MKDKKDEPIKPKLSLPPVGGEDTDSVEEAGDRITEKLSIAVPTQPLLRPTGLMTNIGQRVRLLLRDGTVVVGFLQKRQWNYVHLLNVEEIGRDFKLTAGWCDVEIGSIARVYPATAKVEQIQNS
ncbi:MAG: hypothetical protein ACLP29_08075 [Dissulfurispiraceae bacterium]